MTDPDNREGSAQEQILLDAGADPDLAREE